MNDLKGRSELDNNETFVEKLKSGDRKAFAALVEEHQGMVYNLALRMTGNRELAEDLAQEVFLRAYRGLPSFEGRSNLSTWIYRITYNTAMNELEKARYRYEKIDPLEIDRERSDLSTESDSDDPLSWIERAEVKDRLRSLIEKLKPQQRTALLLYYQGDRSYEEISRIMDLPLGSVKTALFRAKETLRKLILEGEEL